MKVGIIGCGAIGLLAASYLSGYHDVTLYARRKQQMEELNNEGFTRLGLNGEVEHIFVEVKLLEQLEYEEVVIICVKQYNLPEVIEQIKQNESMPIIFLQNGMGHEQLARSLANPLYIGITDHGARIINSFQVAQTGAGQVLLGCIQGNKAIFAKISAELNNSKFPVVIEDNWRAVQKMKLVANAVINPITALFRLENGAILKNIELQKMAKELCFEAANVLKLDPVEAWKYCTTIIANTSTNRSSMLQDIDAGRKTEIHAILGYLISQGVGKYPAMQFLNRSIKVLENESDGKQATQ